MFETLVDKLQKIKGQIASTVGLNFGHEVEKLGQERNLENYGNFSVGSRHMDYYRQLDPDNIHNCDI